MSAARRFGQMGILVAVLTATIVILLIAAGVLFLAAGDQSAEPEAKNANAGIDRPLEAPDGDMFVRLLPGIGAGPEAHRALIRQVDEVVIPDTGIHLATAISDLGRTELYEWQMAETFDGRLQRLLCTGAFTEAGSSYGCGTAGVVQGDQEPRVLWATSRTGPAVQSLLVENVPEKAVWMVVDTSQGSRIVANTIAGIGNMEWEGAAGPPSRVALFDAAHNQLWSENLGGR